MCLSGVCNGLTWRLFYTSIVGVLCDKKSYDLRSDDFLWNNCLICSNQQYFSHCTLYIALYLIRNCFDYTTKPFWNIFDSSYWKSSRWIKIWVSMTNKLISFEFCLSWLEKNTECRKKNIFFYSGTDVCVVRSFLRITLTLNTFRYLIFFGENSRIYPHEVFFNKSSIGIESK